MENNRGGFLVNEAKVILLSILLTLLTVGVLAYGFREQITDYLFSSLQPEVVDLIPPAIDVVSDEEKVISAIAKVNPAVVSVIVTKDVPVYEQYFETVNPWGPFGGFSVPRIREKGTEEREVGGGSGFVVSSDGLIITNRHVVEDTEARYSVVFSDGTYYEVEVVDRDPQLDIAVLRISELPSKQLPVAKFGDSETLQLGQSVIAIGNALAEFQNTVSLGVVSGLGRSIVASDLMGNSEQLNQVIQTDAAINPGNSGGPLLNLDGEVVGVNVATSQGADNIGFALPSHIVEQVLASVQEYGEIVRPYLGVRYTMINQAIKEQYSLTEDHGALIIEGADGGEAIQPGSPADRVDLQIGDVIVEVDGTILLNRDLATELRNKRPGEEIELTVIRDGLELSVVVTLDKAL